MSVDPHDTCLSVRNMPGNGHDVAIAASMGQKPWWAFMILCTGVFMIVIDGTIVNVALPSIRADLGFSQISLVWVTNAYMISFGGFLMLGGRVGDLYGQRRVFLLSIALFTLASAGCGLSGSRLVMIVARTVQGIGGGVVTAIAVSLTMSLFADTYQRAKAIGIYGFVCSSGATFGLLIAGGLMSVLGWRWIFLINLPIGILVYTACVAWLPTDRNPLRHGRFDIGGALTITAAATLAIYAFVGGNELGWTQEQTWVLLSLAALLVVSFLLIEARSRTPLMPLHLFRVRNLMVAAIVVVLWSTSTSTWYFIATLYMQLVVKLTPGQVSIAFLPADLIMALFGLAFSARLIRRFGVRIPLVVGLLLTSLSLVALARAPMSGNITLDLLPSMLLIGLGGGMASNALLLSALSDVKPDESGVASGMFNTLAIIGGALGLALAADIAALRTKDLVDLGTDLLTALNSGYHKAFIFGAFSSLGAAVIAALALNGGPVSAKTP